MAKKEWAIQVSTGEPVSIREIVRQFESLDAEQQSRFNSDDKNKGFECQFCGAALIARALKSASYGPHFSFPPAKNGKEICARNHNICDTRLDDRAYEHASALDSLSSDPSHNLSAQVIDEWVLDDHQGSRNPRRKQSGQRTTRTTPQQRSGKISQLASLVHAFVNHVDRASQLRLRVPGCQGETYAGVFQFLSPMTDQDRPIGTHIFFGMMNYGDLQINEDKKACLTIRLWFWDINKRKRKYVIKVYTDRWKPAERRVFFESFFLAQAYLNRRKLNGEKAYIYLFWFGTASRDYPVSMIVNDPRKIYLFGCGRIPFHGANLGVEKIGTIKNEPIERPLPERDVVVPETELNHTEDCFDGVVIESTAVDPAEEKTGMPDNPVMDAPAEGFEFGEASVVDEVVIQDRPIEKKQAGLSSFVKKIHSLFFGTKD